MDSEGMRSLLDHIPGLRTVCDQLWPGSSDLEKNEVREFFCPSCTKQLEVDAVPPGYPILANFTPNVEASWLGRPLP